jgi:cyclopropane-fatty-acyl-phospholipid synthase
MRNKFAHLVRLIERQYRGVAPGSGSVQFAVRMSGGEVHYLGGNDPAFTITINNEQGLSALTSLDQNAIVDAYLDSDINIDGDILAVLSLREMFNDNKGARFLWRFIQPLLFGQVKSDKKWIANHYDTEADFFRLFLDKKHRAYSQAVFVNDDESLEDAQARKLNFALESVGAKAGDRVLDIGSGWGSFVEFAGSKGVHVTSLTISQQSKAYVQQVIDQQNLPCSVLLEHFLEHRSDTPYDAIVNCGVTEHLPDYPASLRQYDKLLKPGGYLYLDASADRTKNGHGSFMSRYVFEGNASLLCLHEYVAAVANSAFEIVGVWNDRHNYYLTTKEWAKRLDNHRKEIEQRWGEKLYKIFQLYLWGSAEGFQSAMIDAYRLVLRKI